MLCSFCVSVSFHCSLDSGYNHLLFASAERGLVIAQTNDAVPEKIRYNNAEKHSISCLLEEDGYHWLRGSDKGIINKIERQFENLVEITSALVDLISNYEVLETDKEHRQLRNLNAKVTN